MNAMGLMLFISGESAPWWNYPGLEHWKFINLILFLAVLTYFLRRPLSDAFRGRRENIRRELARAQEERDAALEKLEQVQARLDRLDSEVVGIRERAAKEALEDRER